MKKRTRFVFWISIQKFPSNGYGWTTRGANFWNATYFGWQLSIGLPWKKDYIKTMGIDYINNVNAINKKVKLGILI